MPQLSPGATVHPTAILDGDVVLADDVHVGPHCVLSGSVRIGPGSRLIGNVYLTGPLTLGAENTIYPFVCLGFAPQHAKFDPNEPGRGLEIRDGNTFREHVTIHRAFTDDDPTRIGDRNMFMASSHAGHDCQIGSDCTLVNASHLGGHVEVADGVIVGGGTVVHQFCRLGRGAMLSGGMATSLDVPPHFMLTATNLCGAVNLIGLRRGGVPREEIDTIRWVYRTMYRTGASIATATEMLREREDDPIVAEYIAFIEGSKRGIVHGRGRPVRGVTTDADA